MEKGDKGSTLIQMGVSGWMFLLVPAYPGCPGSKAVKRSLSCSQTYRKINGKHLLSKTPNQSPLTDCCPETSCRNCWHYSDMLQQVSVLPLLHLSSHPHTLRQTDPDEDRTFIKHRILAASVPSGQFNPNYTLCPKTTLTWHAKKSGLVWKQFVSYQ